MASIGYNYLGSCGIKVSNICLGTMTFGGHSGGRPSCDETTSHAILDKYVELGGNFIDTANVYQVGQSEEIIGNWLQRQDRSKLVIATKCSRKMDASDPNSCGASRQHIMSKTVRLMRFMFEYKYPLLGVGALRHGLISRKGCEVSASPMPLFQLINGVEGSLKRLKTSYIDLFYIHLWDYGTPIEETLSALNDLVKSAKVRYIGMSNLKGWQLQKAAEISKQKGYEPIAALQQQYSLLCRTTELEVSEVCEYEKVALLPWSPLKGGWLSGRVSRDKQNIQGTRMEWAGEKPGRAMHSHPDFGWFSEDPKVWGVVEKCTQIAATLGKTVPQVSIRWLLQKNIVPSVVIGVRTLDQLEDNMKAAAGWQLSQEQMKELDQVSEPAAPYPYDYIMLYNQGRFRDDDK